MFDELFEMVNRDEDGDRRGSRNTSARQGGLRGFMSRLFGSDGEDDDDAPRKDSRGRDGALEEDGSERAAAQRRRRDRDDDDGWFDFGD